MTSRFSILLLAGLMLAPISAYAESTAVPAETKVTVGDLIGLDPVGVRSHMAGLPSAWAMAEPGLTLASSHGILSLVSSFDLTEDPVEAKQQEHYASGDYGHPVEPHLECRTFVDLPDETDTSFGTELTLVFTDGHLQAVYRDAPSPPQPADTFPRKPDGSLDFEAERKLAMATPRPSVFIAAPGQLPLQDGEGFVGRWSKQALAPDVKLTTRCAPWQAPKMPKQTGSGEFDLLDQGLAPLAVLEPFINAGRIAARNNGRRLMAGLKIGFPLGQSLDDFAAASGVRVFRDPKTDYAIIALNMGAWSSNALDNMDDVAMIGVNDGTVTWILPSGWRAMKNPPLSANLLCLDEHFLIRKNRRGCDANGYYKP